VLFTQSDTKLFSTIKDTLGNYGIPGYRILQRFDLLFFIMIIFIYIMRLCCPLLYRIL